MTSYYKTAAEQRVWKFGLSARSLTHHLDPSFAQSITSEIANSVEIEKGGKALTGNKDGGKDFWED
jgi:hypothetical protein